MATVHVIESVELNGTQWVISLTNSNPFPEDSFEVPDRNEAFRIKKMLEDWAERVATTAYTKGMSDQRDEDREIIQSLR